VVTYLRIDNLTTASSWHLSQRDRIVSDADGYSGGSLSHRSCRLRTARITVAVVDIARHFQTGQQFDTACEAARRRGQACALVSDDKLRPARPELLKRSGFVLLAAVVDR